MLESLSCSVGQSSVTCPHHSEGESGREFGSAQGKRELFCEHLGEIQHYVSRSPERLPRGRPHCIPFVFTVLCLLAPCSIRDHVFFLEELFSVNCSPGFLPQPGCCFSVSVQDSPFSLLSSEVTGLEGCSP